MIEDWNASWCCMIVEDLIIWYVGRVFVCVPFWLFKKWILWGVSIQRFRVAKTPIKEHTVHERTHEQSNAIRCVKFLRFRQILVRCTRPNDSRISQYHNYGQSEWKWGKMDMLRIFVLYVKHTVKFWNYDFFCISVWPNSKSRLVRVSILDNRSWNSTYFKQQRRKHVSVRYF